MLGSRCKTIVVGGACKEWQNCDKQGHSNFCLYLYMFLLIILDYMSDIDTRFHLLYRHRLFYCGISRRDSLSMELKVKIFVYLYEDGDSKSWKGTSGCFQYFMVMTAFLSKMIRPPVMTSEGKGAVHFLLFPLLLSLNF